ncbi:MAG: SUMF1/EgtB/PvdO family nonheme iron enzyme [Thermoguttaceae bacterium]|nr:SUMF1/EgtB/PvdO family nonheme iron enzyme [Thermoguttaceae bacterium]
MKKRFSALALLLLGVFMVSCSWADELPSDPNVGDRIVLTADGIEYAFRWCPPGEFMMGGDKYDFEKPVHKVKITKGFWLLETEDTQAMWQSVMGWNCSDFEAITAYSSILQDGSAACASAGLGERLQLCHRKFHFTMMEWESVMKAGGRNYAPPI